MAQSLQGWLGKHVPSAENNAIFGQAQSFVPGSATNIQFSVKDLKRYASTGGWGFGQFEDGKPNRSDALLNTCFPCHDRAPRADDLVFTRCTRRKGRSTAIGLYL